MEAATITFNILGIHQLIKMILVVVVPYLILILGARIKGNESNFLRVLVAVSLYWILMGAGVYYLLSFLF